MAAAVIAASTVNGALAALAAVGVVLVFRPLRRPWLVAAPIALILALGASVAAPLALLARVVVSEVVLMRLAARLGAGRSAALSLIVTWRMQLVSLDPTRERVDSDEDEDDLIDLLEGIDTLFESVRQGWASADLYELVRVVASASATVRDRWRAARVGRVLVKVSTKTWLRGVAVRLGFAVALVAGVALVGPGGQDPALWLLVVVTTLLLTSAHALLLGLLGVAVVGLALGWATGAVVLVVSLAVRPVHRYLKQRTEKQSLRGPIPRDGRLTRRDLGRHWAEWDAAIRAADREPGFAIEMLQRLDGAGDPSVRSAALAMRALLELRRSRPDAALRAARRGAAALRDQHPYARRIDVWSAARLGLVQWELGQGLAEILRDPESLPLDMPEAAILVSLAAEMLVESGESDRALLLVEAASSRAADRSDLKTLATLEIALAATRASRGQLDAADHRLDQVSWIWDDDDVASTTEWVGLSGRNALLLGQIALARGEKKQAIECFRRAAVRLVGSAGPLRARALVLGASMAGQLGRWELAVADIQRGIAILELTRTLLSSGEARAQAFLTSASLYATALQTLTDAQRAGVRTAGDVAFQLVEALHRSALAGVLRSGRLDVSAEARAIIERIRELEEDGLDPPPPGRAGSREVPAERGGQRARLQDLISESFADAYLPEPVMIDSVRQAATGAHLLSYHFPSDSSTDGHVVWLPPGGPTEVHEVVLNGGEIEALLGYLNGIGGVPECLAVPWSHSAPLFADLAERLLPAGFRRLLDKVSDSDPLQVVLSPGQRLTRFPFAALRLGDRSFVDTAVLQVVSSFDQLDPSLGRSSDSRLSVLFHGTFGGVDTRTGLPVEPPPAGVRYVPAQSASDVRSYLHAEAFDGAHFAVHGAGFGLDQWLILRGEDPLTAGEALTLPWPPWVLFGSCFVGGVEHRPGSEPMGLPIACLLGGAQAVVGAVIDVSQDKAESLTRLFLEAIAEGEPPPYALRRAQKKLRRNQPQDWATFVCYSSARPIGSDLGPGDGASRSIPSGV